MFTDLRFAIRQLIKNPGFTAIAVLSLALGIGATTAVFSLLNGTLLRPTPYAAAEELVFVSPEKLDGSAFNDSANGAQVVAWQEAGSFRGVAPYHWTFNFLIPDGGGETGLRPSLTVSPESQTVGEADRGPVGPQSGPGSESIEGLQGTRELFSVLGV